jgi:hypothetical protein
LKLVAYKKKIGVYVSRVFLKNVPRKLKLDQVVEQVDQITLTKLYGHFNQTTKEFLVFWSTPQPPTLEFL